MLKRPDQEALLAMSPALARPGPAHREASASASWRFAMVYLTNRTKAILQGRWRQPLVFDRAGRGARRSKAWDADR
jgi:hypothetical protein